MTTHPRKNDHGQVVDLKQPHQPTPLSTWDDATQLATATPESSMPATVTGMPIATWIAVPTTSAGWEQLAVTVPFDEPVMQTAAGKAPASGAVVLESDGRVWVVSPSNRFGGYTNTFPKGKVEAGHSLRANAIKEVFEESGLQVELTGFLCDSVRSTTVTRYYLARRLGGNPADMDWESQAVHLLPMAQLAGFVAHTNDEIVVQSLRAIKPLMKSDIVAGPYGLSSFHRVLAVIAGYRKQFGEWPTRVSMDVGMFEDIPGSILTPVGWQMLIQRLKVDDKAPGTVIANGSQGQFTYDGDHLHMQDGPSVEFWIWGVNLSN